MLSNLILSLFISFGVWQQGKLIKTKITDSIAISVPENFRPMTNDEIADRYFTTTRPLALFTDQSLSVDLGVNKSVTQWEEKDLEIMKSFQKSNIYNLYDNISLLSEGIQEINGRKFAYFEFVSTVKEEDNTFIKKGAINKYTYIQYTILSGYALVFNFSTPSSAKDIWKTQAKQIMQSVELKNKQ